MYPPFLYAQKIPRVRGRWIFLFLGRVLNPIYVSGFVVTYPDEYLEEFKKQKNQVFSGLSIVISIVNELNTAKGLIMSAAADELRKTWAQ